MQILEHEPLRRHTTLRTGGPARFFVAVDTEAAVREALAFARERRVPVFVLGGGSNVLAGDAGFAGLVIHLCNQGLPTTVAQISGNEATAAAGEAWDALVGFAVAHGLGGLENMSLIPGTVGGAVAGNIGAYGAEIKDVLRWAEALDMRTGEVRRFTPAECAFAYRRSFFKTAEGRHFILLRACFGLRSGGPLDLGYRDLSDFFRARNVTTPTLAQVREAVIAIRQSKLPDLDKVGTAGSFFKNPVIPQTVYTELAARHPGLPGHEDGCGLVKIPLGWVLDKICGLKGIRQGNVGTYAQQALVIVNEGGTAAEVTALADHITRTVKQATGLDIEWEVERLG